MKYQAKSRIWIESDTGILLGEGRVRLLQAVEQFGSISAAAQSLGMSYKKAWNLIDSINKNADRPAVVKNAGGSGGGGAVVTDYGKQLIVIYSALNQSCWKFLDVEMEKLAVKLDALNEG